MPFGSKNIKGWAKAVFREIHDCRSEEGSFRSKLPSPLDKIIHFYRKGGDALLISSMLGTIDPYRSLFRSRLEI
jgi:hypothetical protein